MISDQRRCIQRSRFVCRILNFCVKKFFGKNCVCGNWNPQMEFISVEENREFRGACTDGTNLFIPKVTRKKLEAGSMLTAEVFSYGLSPCVGAV